MRLSTTRIGRLAASWLLVLSLVLCALPVAALADGIPTEPCPTPTTTTTTTTTTTSSTSVSLSTSTGPSTTFDLAWLSSYFEALILSWWS